MMEVMIITLWSAKLFVDAEIAKIPKQQQNVLLLDGSKAMTGNLNMGDNAIIGIKKFCCR